MNLKRNLFLLAVTSLCLIFKPFITYATIKLDIKKDFKAKGNGIADDTKAFEKAAQYINQLNKPCTLYIPSGIYRVGKQFTKNEKEQFPKLTNHILYFKNVNQLTILGERNTSKIIYNDMLYYGSFDLNGNPIQESNIKRPFLNRQFANSLGCLIKLENCNTIRIQSLYLDGNMYKGKMNVGGGYGDLGTQLEHTGIYVLNSNKIEIQNCTTTRFGLDGIYLWNNLSDQPNNNINVKDCSSTYNGRQAISICSGHNLNIQNCTFANTGKGIIFSNPGAGIDVEPEDIYGTAYVKNCTIHECKIYNNSGPGILFPPISGSENTNVNNCLIVGNTNFSIWTQQKSVTYNGCNIYGSTVHNFPTENKDFLNNTKYLNCTFSDQLNNVKLPYSKPIYIYNNYLISAATSDNTYYENCNFNSSKSKLIWLSVKNQSNQYFFKNCTIETNSKVNDAIWIPNANMVSTSVYIPKNTLHLGLNFNSGKSTLDKKTLIKPNK